MNCFMFVWQASLMVEIVWNDASADVRTLTWCIVSKVVLPF